MNFDEDLFLQDLMLVPWNLIKIYEDPNDALETWTMLFREVVDQHLPLRQKRVKHPQQPEWMTDEILLAMKTRDRYAKTNEHENRRIWRNKVNDLIRQAKTFYYRTTIEANVTDSKKLWAILKDLAPPKKSASPASIKTDEGLISDPEHISRSFNDFFTNIALEYVEETQGTNSHCNSMHNKLQEYISTKIPEDANFEIPAITEEFVLEQLKALKIDKAVGIDGISPKLLRIAAPIITPSLTWIMNLSIKTGTFPNIWKVAKVIPVYKAGNLQHRGNYRPISILSTLSKLLERHIHSALYSFLTKYSLLHIAQSVS